MWARTRARRERRAGQGRILRLAVTLAAGTLVLTGCSTTVFHSNPASRSSGAAAATAAPSTPSPTGTAGATGVGTAEGSSSANAPAASPTTSTSAVGTPAQPVAPGTVVAVGEIQSSDRQTSGHVVIKNVSGDEYDLIVSGYRSGAAGERSIALTETPTPTADRCALGIDSIPVGALAPNVDQVVTISLPADETGGDPSNLVSLSFATPSGDTTGCSAPVTDHAKLTWAFPAPYGRVDVVDGGAGPGARGDVALVGGTPVSYTVAPGDTMTAVLSRFGLTIGQLQYLNPGSFQKGTASVPQEGFSWNLSAANR